MEQSRIDRISELTRISRARALTPQEQAERQALRAEYVASVKASLTGHLDNTYYVDEKGNKVKLGRKSPLTAPEKGGRITPIHTGIDRDE